jgi:precorrin-6B methylase 2
MIDLSPLVNKTVPFKFHGAELALDLSHALFSSYDVDAGTRLLLKAVGRDEVLAKAGRVLDAGSGVGVIGLSVASAFPSSTVEARDRDLLACAFTERNRLRNKVANLSVCPGLLAARLPASDTERYDYILTNIPAKAGGPVLEAFFATAPAWLNPGGRLAVVIVNPLVEAARGWIAAAGFGIIVEERGANHRAFVVEAVAKTGHSSSPSLDAVRQSSALAQAGAAQDSVASDGGAPAIEGLNLSSYLRCRSRFKLAGLSYEASGIWGLPEFDTVGYGTIAAAELGERALAGSLVRDLLVVNPGLGHLPLWAARRLAPERIVGASRDLLALAATGANLASVPNMKTRYAAHDSLRLDELGSASFDAIFCFPDIVPEYDWISPLWASASRLLKTGASLIVACPPTELKRFEKSRVPGFRMVGERRKKTFEAAAWARA